MNDFKKMLMTLVSGELTRTPSLRADNLEKTSNNSLSIDIEKYFKLVNIYKNTSSVTNKRLIKRNIFQVTDVIAGYLKISKISDITPEHWTTMLNQVKTPELQYDPDLSQQYIIAIRGIGEILSKVNKNLFYFEYAKVKRTTKARLQLTEGLTPNLKKWRKLFIRWIDEVLHIKSSKLHYEALTHFFSYLALLDEKDIDPLIFLSNQRSKESLEYFRKEYPNSYARYLSYLYRFTQWIVEDQMSELDDNGFFVSIGHPLITTYQYDNLQNKTKSTTSHSETVQVKIPTSFLITMQEILTEDNYKWPKSLSNQYFDWLNPRTGKLESIWSPVHTHTFLTMIEIPIRKIQVSMLDSGEGDLQRYNPQNKKWQTNNSPHKGYWNDLRAVKPDRGAITKVIDGLSETVGFYISTNKTADIAVGFGPESGYTIPWNNEILIKQFDELRTWQEKYFPVRGPLPYRNLISGSTSDSKPSKSVLEQTPDRFYLFRCPISSSIGSPASNNILMRFWWSLMEKLEQRLNEQGEAVKIVLKVNEKTNQVERTLFTPHGLRVAGLTSLAEAGVPIEVLSKIIAGHASILMTIYYLKYGNSYITDTLNKARREIEDNAKKDLKNWLIEATYDEAKRYMVANNEAGLMTLLENKALSAIWGGTSLGICPFGGRRCDDGGPLIKKETASTKAKFGPVPGGQGNCMMCRHFVTGLPWLIDLWLHGNKLLEEISFQAKEINVLRSKQTVLTKQRYQLAKNNQSHLIMPDMISKIKNLDAHIETKSERLEQTIYNAHATYNYITRVRKLKPLNSECNTANEFEQNSVTTVNNDLGIDLIETTDFQVKNLLVQASRVYPEIADARVEMERDHFVDQILVNNGLPPLTFSPLTKEEKSAASDALSSLLLSKVGAAECENLNKGLTMFSDVGIEKKIHKVLDSAQKNQSRLVNRSR
jgi:hypothetical protein